MKQELVNKAKRQLSELIRKYDKIEDKYRYIHPEDYGLEYHDDSEAAEFVIAGIAAISRIAGSDSDYAVEVKNAVGNKPFIERVTITGGALKALRNDVAKGYLDSIQELIHADVFSDFLEMAEFLLNDGYKDPAAVILGGVLEEHLRKLCIKNKIATEYTGSNGKPHPKMIDMMNKELAKQKIYSPSSDQHSVKNWQTLRNNAAHGNYGEYAEEHIKLMLMGIRDFLTRYPA